MNKTLFRQFFQQNLPKDMEECISLFAIFGGLDEPINSDEPLEMLLEKHILKAIDKHREQLLAPLEYNPLYSRLLRAVSIGDRRLDSAYRRARIGKERGKEAFDFLRYCGYLYLERSRETPLVKSHPKQRFKKEIEHHKISHKLRFSSPFFRFWFAFVEPFYDTIQSGNYAPFFKNFHAHYNEFVGFTFEELCDLYIHEVFAKRFDTVVTDSGSYWDREIEIDLLSETYSGETWIGECKWTNHKVNKKEFHKLQEKCAKLSLNPDKILLFTKRGFSNELTLLKNPHLYLFCADDLEVLAHRL